MLFFQLDISISNGFTYPRSSVHLRSVSEQDSDDVCLVGSGRQMERRLSADRRFVRRGLVLDQVDHDVHAAHEGGNVEWGQAGLKDKKMEGF